MRERGREKGMGEESEKEMLRNQGLAIPKFTRQADRLDTQERVGVS